MNLKAYTNDIDSQWRAHLLFSSISDFQNAGALADQSHAQMKQLMLTKVEERELSFDSWDSLATVVIATIIIFVIMGWLIRI